MSLADGLAFFWFIAVWRGYIWLVQFSPLRTKTLTHAMQRQRHKWMKWMARRTVRIVDANTISGLQDSTAFFSSTALIAIGGGFGLLTAAGPIIDAFSHAAIPLPIDRSSFYVKVGLLMGLYAYAFFKFGWAYRQFNYCAVLVAATPEADHPQAERAASFAADMNISAASQFSDGFTAFFFSISLLAWFVGPVGFVLSATSILGVLVYRQFYSPPRRIALAACALDDEMPDQSLSGSAGLQPQQIERMHD